MNHRIFLVLAGSLFLFLTACSTKPERPEPPDGYFSTYIEQDGVKKFQYTIDYPEGGQSANRKGRPGNTRGHVYGSSSRGVAGGVTAGTGGRGQRASSGRGYSYEQFQQINSRLENVLERELNKSNFCHQGYRETERVAEPPMVYIRGECNEAASEEDRERFPNDGD